MKQFTATVFLFHEGKVLLHFHKKLQKWLPPGGHVEINETPPEAARREVKEETGLDIHFLEQENIKLPNSFERPYFCLLEDIPATPKEAAHQHMDFIYLGTPADEKQFAQIPEEFRWFTAEETKALDLFLDTVELFKTITSDDGAFLFPKEFVWPASL